MAPLISGLLVALAANHAFAQVQITWGSVVIAYHGEKIPILTPGSHNLTPRGAIELHEAGTTFRDRYIAAPENRSVVTDFFQINGLNRDDIDNTQLEVLTLDDEYQAASALAFMQGLYPPRGGPVVDEESIYAPGINGLGSLDQFPLDGYQYPYIETLSVMDLSYIWVDGHIGCDNYSLLEVEYKNTTAYRNRIDSTLPFYQSLRSSVFSELPTSSILDFRYASDLYEYASFQYNHNNTIYHNSNFTSDDLEQLYNLASEQQFGINSPNADGGGVSSIAGQTMAAKVLQQFSYIIGGNGLSDKLSILFTSYDPFLAFFALSGLSVGSSSSRFKSLPLHGSVMAFELYSFSDGEVDLNVTQPLPDASELFVRFLFRNGTDSSNPLIAYPLFGRGPSQTDMTWSDFVYGMGGFSMYDVSDWCTTCATQSLFCTAINQNLNSVAEPSGSGGSKNGLSPAVYGVIGAAVTVAVAILAGAVLCLLGFRVGRNGQNKRASRASDLGVLRNTSGNGGFKGAEKLASDTDLRLKGGAGATVVRHERVGSWELNDGPKSPSTSLDKDLESGRVVSRADYGRRSEDDGHGANPFGDPVKAIDQV